MNDIRQEDIDKLASLSPSDFEATDSMLDPVSPWSLKSAMEQSVNPQEAPKPLFAITADLFYVGHLYCL